MDISGRKTNGMVGPGVALALKRTPDEKEDLDALALKGLDQISTKKYYEHHEVETTNMEYSTAFHGERCVVAGAKRSRPANKRGADWPDSNNGGSLVSLSFRHAHGTTQVSVTICLQDCVVSMLTSLIFQLCNHLDVICTS